MPATRRSNGEGTLSRLPSGNWRGQVMNGYTDLGRRNVISFTAPTKAEVRQMIRDYQEQECRPQHEEKQVILFGEYADLWYETYRTQVEASTYSNYIYTLRLLKERFGAKPIDSIKTSDINRFINQLEAEGYSLSTIHKCRVMLIKIFDMADGDDLVAKNYARRAFHASKELEMKAHEVVRDAFTLEEVALLMEHLPENLIGYSIRFLLVTGLRLQELLALTPDDIAEDGSCVRVAKAVKIVDGAPVLGRTKTVSSNRIVPVAPKYRPVALWLRRNGGQVYLWCSTKRANLLYDTDAIRRRYYNAIQSVPGVRRLSPHCCRHTYVTMLQHQGVSLETIASLTGHTNINMTREYLHVQPDTKLSAVSTLQSVV